jgi:hypothetical protein
MGFPRVVEGCEHCSVVIVFCAGDFVFKKSFSKTCVTSRMNFFSNSCNKAEPAIVKRGIRRGVFTVNVVTVGSGDSSVICFTEQTNELILLLVGETEDIGVILDNEGFSWKER